MNIEQLNHHWRCFRARCLPGEQRDFTDQRFGQWLMNTIGRDEWPADAPDVFNVEASQEAYNLMWSYLYDFNKGEDNGC